MKYATSISEFILDNVVVYNIEQESNLLQYVSAKYPKLTKFKYFNKWEYMSLPLISNTNVQPLYKNGWGPLLQGLSSQLKTLHIGCIILPEYLFDTLDNAGCELACLKAKSLSHSAFERFINSTQMSFIQILRLDDVKIRTFQFLKKLTLLKKLKLASSLCKKPMRINISRLVENCPFTVKTLSFISIRIIFGLEVSGLNSIKKLSFDNTTLPEDIDGFITRSIPQLSVLKLNCCSLQGVSFNLPKITLSHFYLGDAFPNYVRGVIVSTLRDNERRWMSLENSQSNSDKIQRYSVSDAPVFPAVKSRPAKEMNEVPFFTLECHSVNNLVIRDVW
ncbi:hypothetical protein K501DRAFT_300672 [Backusella circina FSU 941]|nr:hypothetical protein K501DRAFT_300672 [Backusella circina FSU 941]